MTSSRSSLAAAQHPVSKDGDPVGVGLPLEHRGRSADGHERGAQVVAEHGREHFIDAQRRRAFLQFARLCLLAALQLEENVGLVDQHVGINGLVKKVHRATFVAPKLPVVFARSRRDEDQRNMPRALATANELSQLEPAHLRHLHFQQGQRHIGVGQ